MRLPGAGHVAEPLLQEMHPNTRFTSLEQIARQCETYHQPSFSIL